MHVPTYLPFHFLPLFPLSQVLDPHPKATHTYSFHNLTSTSIPLGQVHETTPIVATHSYSCRYLHTYPSISFSFPLGQVHEITPTVATIASAVTTQLSHYLQHSLTQLQFNPLNTSISSVFSGGHNATSGGGHSNGSGHGSSGHGGSGHGSSGGGHNSSSNAPVFSVQHHPGAFSPSSFFRPPPNTLHHFPQSNFTAPNPNSQSNPAPTSVYRPPLVMISAAAGRQLRVASPGFVSISPLTQNNIRSIDGKDFGALLRICAMTGDTITMKG